MMGELMKKMANNRRTLRAKKRTDALQVVVDPNAPPTVVPMTTLVKAFEPPEPKKQGSVALAQAKQFERKSSSTK